MVRAAMAFALQKLGHNYLAGLVDLMNPRKCAPDCRVSAGARSLDRPEPAVASAGSDPAIRANVAEVLGTLGSPAAESALQPITQDKDHQVAEAATRSLQQLKTSRP